VGIIHLESFVDLMDTQEFSSMEDIKSTLNTFKLEIESDEKLAEDEKVALLSAYHLIFFNLETIIQTVEDNTISTPVARCRFFCKTWRVLKSMYVGGAVGALIGTLGGTPGTIVTGTIVGAVTGLASGISHHVING